jgi:hypothetical protein
MFPSASYPTVEGISILLHTHFLPSLGNESEGVWAVSHFIDGVGLGVRVVPKFSDSDPSSNYSHSSTSWQLGLT